MVFAQEVQALLPTLASLPRAVMVVDCNGVVQFVNPSLEALTGYAVDDLVGGPVGLALLDKPGVSVAENIQTVAASGQPWKGELLSSQKAGQNLAVEVIISPIRGTNGRSASVLVTVRPIQNSSPDASLRLDALVHQSVFRLIRLAGNASVGELLQQTIDEVCELTGSKVGFYHFVSADQQTVFLQAWSTATLRDYCKAEGVGLHHDLSRAGVWADCVREGKAVIQNDYQSLPGRNGLPPGHTELVRELVVPVFKGGRIVAILGVGNKDTNYDGQDVELVTRFAELAWAITERKLVEVELRDSQHLLTASQQVAGLGSYVLDIKKGTWTSSTVLDRIYGIDGSFPRTVQGWSSLVHPESREQMAGYLADWVLKEHKRFDQEYRIVRHSDGEIRWVHGLGELEFDADGLPVRMLGTIRDITERKLADAAKARLEDQLRQSQKLESIGRLAGGVAHDFNNLLTVINGYSCFLLKGLKDGDPLRSYADEIRIAGERAASLTKQLLAFSRKQLIEPRALDLNTTVRESAPMLQRLIGEDIVLKTHLDASLGRVMADPDQLHQVIMNLAVNARDAMPDGGTLEIRTANVEIDEATSSIPHGATPGRYVLMAVTDTGHGMDETVRSKIFEPFFTTKELGKGTGLGLSTAYGIIRQNRGWIDVRSEVGAGTTFKIYLPRIDASPAPEPNRMSVLTKGGNETVLVVEDQEAVRTFTVAALKRGGYYVIEASEGSEAVAVAGRHKGRIHLLLTDVVMPGINGKELSERLKVLHPDLAVVFTSGYTADVIAQRGVLNPGVALLQKPFSPDALAAKVRAALDHSDGLEGPASAIT